MRILAGFLSVLLCLWLTSCRALSPPDAAALTLIFTEPFVAGFTVSDTEDSTAIHGVFTRSAAGDTVTVTGTYGNTVFCFADGQTYLCTSGNHDGAQWSIPVTLPPASPVTTVRALFSVIPCETDTAQRIMDTVCVTTEDGTQITFTGDGLPTTLCRGTMTVTLHSFQTEAS